MSQTQPLKVHGINVGILGMGISGQKSAEVLAQLGAKVHCWDTNKMIQLSNRLTEMGVTIFYDNQLRLLLKQELIVVSPGIPKNHVWILKAKTKGIPVMTEVELAYQLKAGDLIGITGTNGKSTVTTLLGEIFKDAGLSVFVGGNLGMPLIANLLKKTPHSLLIAEISSFQLEHISQFRPHCSIVLNLSPDHLTRYDSEEDYYETKLLIALNQTREDVLIVNMDDKHLAPWAKQMSMKVQVIPFSLSASGENGVYLKEEKIWAYIHGAPEAVIRCSELGMSGIHNLSNAMACIAAAVFYELPLEVIQKTLKAFTGIPHRMEFLGQIKELRFFNDSKATNLGALSAALDSFEEPIHLIAGGQDKGNDLSDLKEKIQKRVAAVYLIGEAKDKIAKSWKGATHLFQCGDLDGAVEKIMVQTQGKGVVLLSPGCASFDQFNSFEDRGNQFRQIVLKLIGSKI